MALSDWFKRHTAASRRPERKRTREIVIVSEVAPAEVPNQQIAADSKRATVNLVQSILEMERKAAHLNTTLAELTLKNFNGGRS